MLKIRDQHLVSLGEQQTAGFVARMILHLRDVFGAEVARLDDRALEAFVSKVCVKVEEWGMTLEPVVEGLLELFVSFDALRRSPLPEWISNAAMRPGRNGFRLLLAIENGLQFAEGRVTSVTPFYARVYEGFYSKVKEENGGVLPASLQNADGQARLLTMSLADHAYRRQWKLVAAQMRKSQATPTKSLKCSSTPWLTKTDRAKFAPVTLPSAHGPIRVPILAGRPR